MQTRLTDKQKLHALAAKYYQHLAWVPKAGDYYTSARADNELYQIVKIEDGIVFTKYCEGSDALSEWEENGFNTAGFGLQRVWVPDWVLNLVV